MSIKEFQQDLNKGMSIHDACQKHQISFKKAFNRLHYKKYHRPRYGQGELKQPYITRNGKQFQVKKKTRGKTTHYGNYTTLEEAIRVRDFLLENDWKKSKLKELEL